MHLRACALIYQYNQKAARCTKATLWKKKIGWAIIDLKLLLEPERGAMKHLPGTFIIAKSPDYCRGLIWSISTMSVVFECFFKIDNLPVHASSPCWITTRISEPLASLADVVLVDKPLVCLIYLPCSFKLPFGRLWNVMEYMAV